MFFTKFTPLTWDDEGTVSCSAQGITVSGCNYVKGTAPSSTYKWTV